MHCPLSASALAAFASISFSRNSRAPVLMSAAVA
jgi:hypothetical protein